MNTGKYKNFSNRLIDAMKASGHVASRSPSGICIPTLSKFAGASEQICRRYIRGDALPDYDKVINIARSLNTSAGWLLFGEAKQSDTTPQTKTISDDLLHYILEKSHPLYRDDTDDYADYVLELIRDVRAIDTSTENLEKIIDLAISSISSYQEKERIKQAM